MATTTTPMPAPAKPVAIMFVDQVGSTRMCAELGDAVALDLHCRLHRVLLSHITACGGWRASTTGDGALALFASPVASITAASAIQAELSDASRAQAGLARTEVRVGIHLGTPLMDPGGVPFGLCVNLAARICARAGAGEVLVSDLTRVALDWPDRHCFVAPQSVTLRGAPGSIRLWRVADTSMARLADIALASEPREPIDPWSAIGCRARPRARDAGRTAVDRRTPAAPMRRQLDRST
jgi:adenylate cyclase